MDATRTADALERAADLIQTVGHCKEDYEDRNDDGQVTGYCAMGAINQATTTVEQVNWSGYMVGLHRVDHETRSDALAALAVHITITGTDKTYSHIPEWNDDPARTPEQVIDAMKHAAKDLRNTA